MKAFCGRVFVWIVACEFALLANVASGVTFEWLAQPFDANYSWESHMVVSADGSTVIATRNDFSSQPTLEVPHRWTRATGWLPLPAAPGFGPGDANIRALSANGDAIAGSVGNRPFRWSQAAGYEFPPAGSGLDGASAWASNISDDGRYVVGTACRPSGSSNGPFPGRVCSAFRWTVGEEVLLIEGTSRVPNVEASAVSIDGAVIGISLGSYPQLAYNPFLWTPFDGLTNLGFLPDAHRGFALAEDISADGRVVIGIDWGSGHYQSFMWTEESGVTALGHLIDSPVSGTEVTTVSADGSTIVGSMRTNNQADSQIAVFWQPGQGWRDLTSVLTYDDQIRELLGDWRVSDITGISADGRTMVGWATFTGATSPMFSWIATIPEPGTYVLVSIGIAVLGLAARPPGANGRNARMIR